MLSPLLLSPDDDGIVVDMTRVDEHARGLADVRLAITSLEQRMDRRFEAIDRRFEGIDGRLLARS